MFLSLSTTGTEVVGITEISVMTASTREAGNSNLKFY